MIQKITPKKFVSDKDERLVAANEMILAENVTISERADGSSSILKTMKGTQVVGTAQGEDVPDATWKVVGSVTDNQRSRVYAFVYDTADDTDHRIVMSEDGAPWVTVFKDEYLNFDEDYPVKADLINKAFQQDGVVQTVMYFTDNNNPPRKINIDRALAGDYTDEVDVDGNQVSPFDIDLDYSILAMRGAPLRAPEFSFANDTSVSTNNFQNDTFQFACQFIYKDGEESALSSYSSLAVPPFISNKGSTSVSTGSVLSGNVCLITIPWDIGRHDIEYSDVLSVRLLARSQNSNPFFIIDEFDPTEDLTRDVADSPGLEIYNAGTAIYRFYNDGYYPNISDVTASKLYDNVPLKAEGQTLGASRLLYSNYEEGYPNYDIEPSVTMTVEYGSDTGFGNDYPLEETNVVSFPIQSAYSGETDPATARSTAQTRGEININLNKSATGAQWPGDHSDGAALNTIPLPEGTTVRLAFKWNPKGHYYSNSGTEPGYYKATYYHGQGEITVLRIGMGVTSKVTIPSSGGFVSGAIPFDFSYTTNPGETVQDVYDAVKNYFTNGSQDYISREVKFAVDNLTAEVSSSDVTGINNGDPYTLNPYPSSINGQPTKLGLKATFRFRSYDSDDAGIIKILPWLAKLVPTSYPPASSSYSTIGTNQYTFPNPPSSSTSGTSGWTTTQTTSNNQSNTITTASYISSVSAEATNTASGFSFKGGSSHDLGIVYYDKWGRSGFVNKIGSIYAQHPSERMPGDNKGGASINVSIDDSKDATIPSWADKYQFVYGGSQYTNVFQYTTGGAYMVMEGGAFGSAANGNPADNELVENDHRIYVSLNTLSQIQTETGTPRDYSFTEGDICRVISYTDGSSGDRIYPHANDGSIIEFEVVGVETLSDSDSAYADGEGNPLQWHLLNGTPSRRGTFLVLRAPRVDGDASVRALKLVEDADISDSSSVAAGNTTDTSNDTSDTVTVTRNGVDVTSSLGSSPSFSDITVTNSGTSLDSILVDDIGDGVRAGDVITFSCVNQSAVEITVTLTEEDLASEGLKYQGFDWFSVVKKWAATTNYSGSAVDYPGGDAPDTNSLWGQETVIEILTPKKVSDTPIYYEIGKRIDLGLRSASPPAGEGVHGPTVKLTEGDVQLRTVSCRSPKYFNNAWNDASPGSWNDVPIVLENETPGEYITEKAWGKGRPQAVFERAATVNRYNSITYSQPYADDTSVLSLSSFVPSQGNFFDLPSEHGACTFLGISSDQLIAMQENKVSRLGLNKDVLETGSQAGVVTISTQLINNLVSYAGDYGTSNPESVLIRDGIVYFADVERRSIVKLSSKGLEVISDKEINSKVESKFSEWQSGDGKTIVSGYDPEDKIYYFTMSPTSEFDGYTLGYDEKGGFWQGSYTFYADRYASLKDRFFGWKYGGGNILHEFKDGNVSNKFFGATSPVASKIRVVSNANPSRVKTYQALSLESNSVWNVKLLDSVGRSTQNVDLSKREGAFYGEVKGLHTSPGYIIDVDDNRYLPVGTIESISTVNNVTVITFANNLRGMNIPANYKVFALGTASNNILSGQMGSVLQGVAKVASVNRSESSITLDVDIGTFANLGAGDKIFVANDSVGLTSDRVRDHYAIIEANYTPAETISEEGIGVEELYAINVHFSNSPLNDAIG